VGKGGKEKEEGIRPLADPTPFGGKGGNGEANTLLPTGEVGGRKEKRTSRFKRDC